MGASINLEVPSNLFKPFRGIALCAVFRPHQHRPPSHRCFTLHCQFKANGNEFNSCPCVTISAEFDMVKSDHCWFTYLLRPNFEHYFSNKFLQIVDESNCQLEIEFRAGNGRMMEIKKCGARMVYEEEMEDLKQSMDQIECNIIPNNEGVDHFEEDIKSKRSRDDENGASGDVPHPKTKRV